MGLEGPGRAHGENLGRALEYYARLILQKLTKEEIELEESGGPVVWKKGNDHIEKYGDEKFALYKDGKKTKYYKSMDDAKAALDEAKDEGAKKEATGHEKPVKKGEKVSGKKEPITIDPEVDEKK
jgi:hypothetical protein